MSKDIEKYELFHIQKELDHELLCKRCGKCCGAGAEDGDFCTNLIKCPDGTFFCKDYQNRFGVQKTKSGREFNCVPIREVIKYKYTRQDCAYRQ